MVLQNRVVQIIFVGLGLLALTCKLPAGSSQNNQPGCFQEAHDRMQAAALAMNRGSFQLALEEFIYLLEHGHLYGREFNDMKRSFLLIHLKNLAGKYPPAREAVEEHLAKLMERVVLAGYQAESMEHVAFLVEIFSLDNKVLEPFNDMMAVIKDEQTRREWTLQCLAALVRARRYRDLVKNVDLVARSEELLEKLAGELREKPEQRETIMSMAACSCEKALLEYAEICRQLGDEQAVEKIDRLLLKLEELRAE